MKPLNNIRRPKGFTLIELMITIAIAAILMTLAVPSFSLMINNSKITSKTNEFIGSLNLARSEALKRSNNVSMCKSNTTYSACVSDGTIDSYSQNGWLIFSDCNADGVVDNTVAAAACADGGVDTIIKVGESNDAVKIDYQMDFLTYNLSGRIVQGGDIEIPVETTTSNTSIKKNKITINRIGRVRSCKVDGSFDCVN